MLPKRDSNGKPITYKEYDINPEPKHGSDRGKERMVIGSDGKAYYTRDHYKTFTEFKY
jgi:guanyl-specific ribonuclease Sa